MEKIFSFKKIISSIKSLMKFGHKNTLVNSPNFDWISQHAVDVIKSRSFSLSTFLQHFGSIVRWGSFGNRFNNRAITFHFLVSVNTTSCEIISKNCLTSYRIQVNRMPLYICYFSSYIKNKFRIGTAMEIQIVEIFIWSTYF